MSLRHAILGVLEFTPLHGYALKNVLERGISEVWPVNMAAIYPSLRRLAEEGLVSQATESTQSGRPDRKVYSLTDRGREELTHWRQMSPDLSEYQLKNPLMLKLIFSKRENLPNVAQWLDVVLSEMKQRLEDTKVQNANPQGVPFFVRFANETGQAHLELSIEQLSRLRREVETMLEGQSSEP